MNESAKPAVSLDHIAEYLNSKSFQVPSSLLVSVIEEVATRAEPPTLRAWCHLFGKVWAERSQSEFADAADLTSLNAAVNTFLARNSWGWVQMSESDSGLDVVHGGSPITAVDVRQHLAWTCGLLEGFYDSVFKQLGADESMRVRTESVSADYLELHLQLGA